MKKMVLAVLTLAAVLLPAGVRVFCFAPPSSHARFWPGTLADDVGRNGVLSEPQQRIHDIANALDAHKLGDLIKQYKKAAVSEPGSAVAHFALGYAYQVQTAYASLKPEQLHLEEGAIERQLQ